MTLPTTLLVPVDFSAFSEAALAFAVELAKPLNARIVVMHAYELPIYGFPSGTVVATPDMAASIMTAAQSGLDAMTARFADDVKIEKVLRLGPPSTEVNEVAKEVGAGMIVIGTHGRSGVARFFLGSIAEKIVRFAALPVLTVREPHPA